MARGQVARRGGPHRQPTNLKCTGTNLKCTGTLRLTAVELRNGNSGGGADGGGGAVIVRGGGVAPRRRSPLQRPKQDISRVQISRVCAIYTRM